MDSNRKYLLLKGCAGLGNRLITLTKAVEYAQKHDRTLLIDWSDGQYFEEGHNFFDEYFYLKNINYESHSSIHSRLVEYNKELFYPTVVYDKLTEPIDKQFTQIDNPFLQKVYYKWPNIFPSKFGGIWMLNEEKKYKSKTSILTFLSYAISSKSFPLGGNLRAKKALITVFVDYRPNFNKKLFKNVFAIKDEIIQSITSKITFNIEECIGIHIRATDMQPTAEVEILIEEIKEKFPNQPLFLATDNAVIEKRMLQEGLVIKKIEKNLSTESTKALHKQTVNNEKSRELFEQGLADMYLLSKTKYLYFQGNSSFSIIANVWRNETQSKDWLKIKSK